MDMLQALHERVESLDVAAARCVGLEPFAEGGIKSLVLGSGHLARLLDKIGVGAEGDVFHENSVHEIRVIWKSNVECSWE